MYEEVSVKGLEAGKSIHFKMEVIRDGLSKAATSVLGWEDSKQPDWFVELYSVKALPSDYQGKSIVSKMVKNSASQPFVCQHRQCG